MKKQIVISLIALFSTALANSNGVVSAGKTKAMVCGACHGPNGNSTNPDWPKLAGQNAKYLSQQIIAFQKGERKNASMAPMVANLSKQDIADIAAYFETQKGTTGKTPAKYVKLGQEIYQAGDKARKIPACAACHGPDGKGNREAGFPRVAGQHAKYSETQLLAYQNKTRPGGAGNIMYDVAKKLSKADIVAVANYMQGLHS